MGIAFPGIDRWREWRPSRLLYCSLVYSCVNHSAITRLSNRFILLTGCPSIRLEAILWRGGDVLRPRDAFAAVSTEDRNALLAFLDSI